MGIRTVTYKTCDRCGGDVIDHGPKFGELIVSYRGQEGGTSMQSDVGGCGLMADTLLCHECIPGFLAYMRNETQP